MSKRFVSIWFRHLRTDWFAVREPALSRQPFVLTTKINGRAVITALNAAAEKEGIEAGMAAADARAIVPGLQHKDDPPALGEKILQTVAEWLIRFTPLAATDAPDGITLDVTGCAHLWGGEATYLRELGRRLQGFGYDVRLAMAGTIGSAWAVARFSAGQGLIAEGELTAALLDLPPAALRLDPALVEKLTKLGLSRIGDLLAIPRPALRRRFGEPLTGRIDQAFGKREETFLPVQPPEPYQERLPCLEPIATATGIAIAIQRLLDTLLRRLEQEQQGLRQARFKGYRVDGKMVEIAIGTHRPSRHAVHLLKLFEPHLPDIAPGLGIELFVLEAPVVEPLIAAQEHLWEGACGLEDTGLAELLDRLANRIGAGRIHRYLPAAHYWPERSLQPAASLTEKATERWRPEIQRPLQLLPRPEPIEVTAPVPDYPPMLFRYRGVLHKIKKADGPERIEREWWYGEGRHRDYYVVEDDAGQRYWIFRSGHYAAEEKGQWFLHGFFA